MLADECDKPANPSHGSVETPDGTEIGDEAIYTCDVCYAMDGNDVRTCLPTGYWSGQAPTCSRKLLVLRFYDIRLFILKIAMLLYTNTTSTTTTTTTISTTIKTCFN